VARAIAGHRTSGRLARGRLLTSTFDEVVATALWRRTDRPGHDAARLLRTATSWRIEGLATFRHAEGPAALWYRLECDRAWRSRLGRVQGFVGDRTIDVHCERVADRWTMNGVVAPGLERCEDLDFGFTPATNLTQLRRIALPVGAQAVVPVAWFEPDEAGLTELAQWYGRQAPDRFGYEAPRFGYTATLAIGRDGFVDEYPRLWERIQ